MILGLINIVHQPAVQMTQTEYYTDVVVFFRQ